MLKKRLLWKLQCRWKFFEPGKEKKSLCSKILAGNLIQNKTKIYCFWQTFCFCIWTDHKWCLAEWRRRMEICKKLFWSHIKLGGRGVSIWYQWKDKGVRKLLFRELPIFRSFKIQERFCSFFKVFNDILIYSARNFYDSEIVFGGKIKITFTIKRIKKSFNDRKLAIKLINKKSVFDWAMNLYLCIIYFSNQWNLTSKEHKINLVLTKFIDTNHENCWIVSTKFIFFWLNQLKSKIKCKCQSTPLPSQRKTRCRSRRHIWFNFTNLDTFHVIFSLF